jgi:hypothetical protein
VVIRGCTIAMVKAPSWWCSCVSCFHAFRHLGSMSAPFDTERTHDRPWMDPHRPSQSDHDNDQATKPCCDGVIGPENEASPRDQVILNGPVASSFITGVGRSFESLRCSRALITQGTPHLVTRYVRRSRRFSRPRR